MIQAVKRAGEEALTRVAQAATTAPSTPAVSGDRSPGFWYAPTKPTNSRTMMSGPGVVSASPSPTTICPGSNHPYWATAATFTYDNTA